MNWPPVLTRPTRSPLLSGRIRLKDTVPPQPQELPAEPPCWPAAELCSLCTLRLDTDRTASMRSPCFAVSRPEIKYRPSCGTVKIPVDERRNDLVRVYKSIIFCFLNIQKSASVCYSWTLLTNLVWLHGQSLTYVIILYHSITFLPS